MHVEVPDYKELSVRNVMTYVRENATIMNYLPDFRPNQYPEHEFLYGILGTLYPKETEVLVNQARKKRATDNKDDKEELVAVDKQIFQNIEQIANLKSKCMSKLTFNLL